MEFARPLADGGRRRAGRWLSWIVGALACLALVGCARAQVKPSAGAAPTKPTETEGIAWTEDLDSGLAQARDLRKPVMVEVSTTWCEGCKRLHDTVLTRPEVIAASRDFVAVHIDGDKQPGVVDRLGVRQYPTVLFLNPDDRKEIGRVLGPVPYQIFLDEMGRAKQKASPHAT